MGFILCRGYSPEVGEQSSARNWHSQMPGVGNSLMTYFGCCQEKTIPSRKPKLGHPHPPPPSFHKRGQNGTKHSNISLPSPIQSLMWPRRRNKRNVNKHTHQWHSPRRWPKHSYIVYMVKIQVTSFSYSSELKKACFIRFWFDGREALTSSDDKAVFSLCDQEWTPYELDLKPDNQQNMETYNGLAKER